MNEEEIRYYLELLKEAVNEAAVRQIIIDIWEDAQDDLLSKENE